MPLVSRFSIAATLLTIAIVFGGGGSPAPISELIVQIATLAALCAWFWLPAPPRVGKQIDYPLWIGVGAFIAIPLVQLVPLPPSLWHSFPGRETELAALTLIGAGDSWRPISVSPYVTLASALSLIPPVTMLYFTSRLPVDDRTRLLAAATGIALFSAIIGVVQVASGNGDWPRFYQHSNIGYATGFQDNRNGTADIFLLGLLAMCALVAARRDILDSAMARLVALAIALFLCLSVILTGSRAGTALLLVCPVVAALIFRPRLRFTPKWVIAAALCVAILGGAGYVFRDNPALNRTWARFASVVDTRPRIWEDSRFAVGQYWPMGSGMGTFTTVFPAAERLEGVHSSTTNRAHQDYLEFTLEAGIVGILLCAGALLALGYRAIMILLYRRERLVVIQALFGAGGIAILALHSLVDYPMRSMSLATAAALCIGFLSRSDRGTDKPRRYTVPDPAREAIPQ